MLWSIELKWFCAPQDQYKAPCDEDNLIPAMNEYGWINDVEANANLMDSIPNYRHQRFLIAKRMNSLI